MNALATKAVLAGLVAVTLAGCGGGGPALSDNERKYADQCTTTLAAMGQSGKQTLCGCTARILVPKLSPGELNSFVNMGPDLMGKALTDDMTRPHGFTVAENMSYFTKFQESKAEIDRQCGT